ncbi:Aldehyde dehydrogenase [hydrothermal vent metagenome]|uniref:Aldehyde dehydrogenase n=1 Tax=hydrothermal vent metagenome TaxID=652676 RepID=A0A1W1ELN1_9ZZZZ
MRFLDMKTDYAFKKVFGSENSKDILLSFLNSTLELGREIVDLTIEDPYNVPKLQGMKDTSVDVKATLDDKTKVIIEMQILNHDGLESRILYNTAKNYSNQLDSNNKYTLLNPVIALTILNFQMFDFRKDEEKKERDKKYKSSFKLFEKEKFIKYKDDIELIFIELPKFKKDLEECKNIEDKWIYFIKNARSLDVIPKDTDSTIKKAYEIANRANLTKEELELQEKREDFLFIQKSSIEKAKREAREDGIKEGLKKGKEEGIEQGKNKKAIEIAKNLLDVLDNQTISQKTGLSIQDIENLRES